MIAGLHYVRVAATATRPIRYYVYAWRGGPRIMVSDGPIKPKLSREAVAAYAAAQEEAKVVQADTLAGAARQWRGNPVDVATSSPEWRKLAVSTRTTWGRELDLIEDKWGNTPLTLWNDPRMVAKVVAWRDSRAATPRSADIGVTVLDQLLGWCRLRAKITINVASGIPSLYSGADRAEIIWTEEDLALAAETAAQINRPRAVDALRLACLTGFRRADLVAVTLDEVGDHAIIRTAQKKSRGRRRRAVVPLLPGTRALIADLRALPRLPSVRTLLVTSKGTPWTGGSLTQAINQVRDAAGIAQPGNPAIGVPDRAKHLHDCRGTFVTKLCRAGLTDREIADIAAWSPESVATIRKTYVDDAAVVVALSERIRRAV